MADLIDIKTVVLIKAKLFRHYRRRGFGIDQSRAMAGIKWSNKSEYPLIIQHRIYIDAKKPNQALPGNND